mgnify:CR=1 FL=1
MNNDVGSVLSFKIDDDFSNSTPSIDKNFLLMKKDLENETCLFVESNINFAESLLDTIWSTFLYHTSKYLLLKHHL